MMTEERSGVIDAPPDRVWKLLADYGAIASWAPNVDHSCLLTDRADGVGAVNITDGVYVLNRLFAGGPPTPGIPRCSCRDRSTETLPDRWAGCPWIECDGCRVTCPADSTCVVDQCVNFFKPFVDLFGQPHYFFPRRKIT